MFTNILHIPTYFKQSMMLTERIIEDDVLKKLILGSDLTLQEISAAPVIVSTVSSDYLNLNITNLSDIFPPLVGGHISSSLSVNRDRNYFKVKVSVFGILP